MTTRRMRMNECTIFIEALERESPIRRSEYLDSACAGDTALRQRVEALLASHDQTGEFLVKLAPERLAEELAVWPTGDVTEDDDVADEQSGVELDFLTPSSNAGSLGRLGHYDVQEVIGRGGMGIVLRAFDETLHRIVAIKVMADQLATSAAARKRFMREAQAAAAVTHDQVVTIHAVEEASGRPYIVMQYVAGMSLAERLQRDGPLELHEILRVGMQTAAGLVAAHAQGLIHRDVKPANILLENGVERVKITDFGLARAASDASLTQNGAVAGTPHYMAPEQARGEVLDARTDLFSLGSVLYAMCTGRSPFRATGTMAVLKRVCDDSPAPIRDANPEIPDWLVAIIEKLHAKNPAERFQSAAEVADLLGRHLAHIQHPSIAPLPAVDSLPIGSLRPRRPSRRWGVAAAIVLLCLLSSLSLTEATGVTQLASTVIRLVTGEGTLVIEIDDPSVQIALDGEELSISGAGLQEITLRPGQYQFEAIKDGRPFKTELVSIRRGDRQIVRVTREPAAAVPAISLPIDRGAFVLLSTEGADFRKFDSLAEAVEGAIDGDTIEIRGNGPFVMQPIVIHQSLTIRAGEEFSPVLRIEPGAPGDDCLIAAFASLVLEGLDIREVSKKRSQPALVGRSIIYSDAKSLHLANCRLQQEEPVHEEISLIMCPTLAVFRNCQFRSSNGTYVSFANDVPVRFALDNCVGVGGLAVYLHYAHVSNEAHLEFRRNTLVTNVDASVGFSVAPDPPQDNADEKRVQFDASDNVFDSRLGMFSFERLATKVNWQDASDVEATFAPLIGWRDRRNVYSPSATSIHWALRQGDFLPLAPAGLRDWQNRWGLSDAGSIEGDIRLHGGDLLVKAATVPDQITPDDFRLRPDSAGYRAGPDGKDLGADVDLVGPGPAYERWKQTPEYQDWLDDSGQRTESDLSMPDH